jgi:hypothetical protein
MALSNSSAGRRGSMALIFLGGISLLAGLWSGLARMGWLVPIPNEHFVVAHGPLMVVGFVGTLIGLERAVALGRRWPYSIPVLTALSAGAFVAGLQESVSALLAAAASLVLIGVFAVLYRQYPSEHFIVMGLSALAWLVGNLRWAAEPPLFTVVPWWAAFLVLMIAGERLELSRVRRPPVFVRIVFYLGVAALLVGLAGSLVDFQLGVRIAGAGLFAVALWLLRYDLAWHSARQQGLPRYMALSLIAGYFWLATAGVLWLGGAPYFSAGPRYDAMLHAIFLGFVFSMIFAHAPIILPTIAGFALPYRNLFYLHAALLHLSVLLRVAGDLSLSLSLQRWGGLLSALAIFLFIANNVGAVRAGARERLSERHLS